MRRWLLRLIFAVLVSPFVYGLAGFVGAVVPGGQAAIGGERTETIGLVRGPIHFDFLLPLSPDVLQTFAFSEDHGVPIRHPDARWLVVGWGAEGFYTTVGDYSDLDAGVVWRAITGDRAVLHLEAIGAVADFDGLSWVKVSPEQLEALTTAIAAFLIRDTAGQPIAYPAARYGETDMFYAAQGRFDLSQTCNVWIGQMTRAAGLRFGVWTPTPQAVSLSLKWFAEAGE